MKMDAHRCVSSPVALTKIAQTEIPALVRRSAIFKRTRVKGIRWKTKPLALWRTAKPGGVIIANVSPPNAETVKPVGEKIVTWAKKTVSRVRSALSIAKIRFAVMIKLEGR